MVAGTATAETYKGDAKLRKGKFKDALKGRPEGRPFCFGSHPQPRALGAGGSTGAAGLRARTIKDQGAIVWR